MLARFESERQALALMDHPNIAKVLDAGTTDARQPVLRDGAGQGRVPLTEYCDRHRLDLPARLGLFRQICSAVQHAHQKGIIHRDLKPTNILVESHDGRPRPQGDRLRPGQGHQRPGLTDHSLFTAFGSVTGTPLYMAPEQADLQRPGRRHPRRHLRPGRDPLRAADRLDADPRDTIKRAALDEMLRVIREVEPPTPSSRISTSEDHGR